MARRPTNVEWIGFTEEQASALDFVDHLGNNGWARTGQTEALMPEALGRLHALGVPIERVEEAMESIGYAKNALHQLDRWESKRTLGKFGG